MVSSNNSGLSGAVKLVVKTFLQQSHYKDLVNYLSEQWVTDCHSLYAAVRLMEAHGVHLDDKKQEEYRKLAEASPDRMIDTLVMQMPQQSREQFEHFFLQLSLIASTTTRLRAALESGDGNAVEDVLGSAENVGVLSYILKMAVSQAGQEVKQHVQDHTDWLTASSDRMSTLLQSQTNAMISQKALTQATAQLGMHRVEANEKSKKVLMGLAGNTSQALVGAVFASWADEVQKTKKEREIRKEYEEEIDAAEKKLQDYVLSQSQIMRNMINKNHANSETDLIATCYQAFVQEVQEKRDRETKDVEMADLNAKMSQFSAEQSAKSKKVLGRMTAGTDVGLLGMCLSAWVQFIAEYNKNREFEDAVKREEAKIAEFLKKQNAGASSVLNRMSQATDQGLVQQCMTGWIEVFTEQKKANELQDILNSGSGRFSEFSSRNKSSAKGAMDRAAELTEQGSMIVVFLLWKREVKVERMRRYAKDKNIKKKNQLMGVKGLFKNFANELEAGLKEGTPRVESAPKKKSGRTASPSPKADPY